MCLKISVSLLDHGYNYSLFAECTYGGNTYRDGEEWTPYGDSDPCFKCTCLDGEFNCETEQCPEPECDNPITEIGKCCPVCPGEISVIASFS